MAVNCATHAFTLFTHTHRVRESLSIHKYTVFKGTVWTFGAALSRWCVGVGTVKRRTRFSLTPYTAMQTGADVTGLVGGRKPLAVAVDPMVVSAAVTNCTTGAGDLSGMQALCGGAACV